MRMRNRLQRDLSTAESYGAAALLVAAATALRFLLEPRVGPSAPFLTFFPAIIVAARLGGRGPGWAATAGSALVCWYVFTEPRFSFRISEPVMWWNLLLFLVAGFVVSVLIGQLRQALIDSVRSGKEFRNLFESMQEGFISAEMMWDERGEPVNYRYLAANPAYLKRAGLSSGQVVGRTVRDLIPAIEPFWIETFGRVVRTGQSERIRHQVAAQGKHFEAFAWCCAPGRFAMVSNDVTERRLAEEALHKAYAELAAIQASAPVLLYVVDQDLGVRDINNLTGRHSERKPGDFSVLHCLDALAHPRGCGHAASCDRCQVRQVLLDTLRNGTQHRGVEAWLPTSVEDKDTQRCFLLSTAPVHLDKTAAKALLCAQDITESKRAGAQIPRQSATLQRQAELIDLSQDAIIIMGPDRVITGWNAGATEMYGWTEREAVGQLAQAMLGTSSTLLDQINEFLARDGRWEGELVHSHKSKRTLLVQSRQVTVRDQSGAPAAVLEINRDITEHRRSELHILELNRDLDRRVEELGVVLAEKNVLLREVQHRVKNNLQVISSLLSLEAQRQEDSGLIRVLQDNRDRIRAMAMIHEQFSRSEDLARIDFGKYVDSLAAYAIKSCALDSNYIRVWTDVEMELEMDDAVPCGLILQELLSNSMKHAFPNGSGEIRIEFKRSGGELRLRYHDNGIGLPLGFDMNNPESLGLQVVSDLIGQLQGRLEYQTCRGASFVLHFKSSRERRNAYSQSNTTVLPA